MVEFTSQAMGCSRVLSQFQGIDVYQRTNIISKGTYTEVLAYTTSCIGFGQVLALPSRLVIRVVLMLRTGTEL